MSFKSISVAAIFAWALSPQAILAADLVTNPSTKPASAPANTDAAKSTAAPAPADNATNPVVAPQAPLAPAPIAPQSVSPSVATPQSQSVSPAAEPAAPVLPAVSGTAEALSAPISATVDASGDSITVEQVGDGGQTAPVLETPDLGKVDSETLATLAGAVDPDSSSVMYDPAAKQVISTAVAGGWQVTVDALYYELAKRMQDDNKDKAARQALALAFMKDGERAKYAKDLAFDDKLADSVIKEVEAKKPKARMDLQALAEKGNRKARLYLGLDKPLAREDAGASSPTAKTKEAPQSASSTAQLAPAAPAPVSPSAKSAPVKPSSPADPVTNPATKK